MNNPTTHDHHHQQPPQLEEEALYPFPTTIYIQPRAAAIHHANETFYQSPIPRTLVIWTDASASTAPLPNTPSATRLSASCLRYLDPMSTQPQWIESATFNHLAAGAKHAPEAEFIALVSAFRAACRLAEGFDRLVVFTDNQSLLLGVRKRSRFSFLSKPELWDEFLRCANWLYDGGIEVEMRWVPAHARAKGNELVDRLARRCRIAGECVVENGAGGEVVVVDGVTMAPCPLEALGRVLVGIIARGRRERKRNGGDGFGERRVVDCEVL